MESTIQQQRIPSPLVSMGLDSGFQKLPTELLDEIYILSETLSLSLVCRRFYVCLNTESTRLRFCTRVFFLVHPYNLESGVVARSIEKQANIILAQEWFTEEFAMKLEDAVLQMQKDAILYCEEWIDCAAYYPHLWEGGMRPARYTKGPVPIPTLDRNEFFTSRRVYIPARLLCGPWTNSKRALLCRLERWGVWTNDTHIHLCYGAIKDAIVSDNVKLFDVLLKFRREMDYELFRLVRCSSSYNTVVRVFLAELLAHVYQYYGSSDPLLDWIKQDWEGGFKQQNPHGEDMNRETDTVKAGGDKVLEENRVKGGAAELIQHPTEVDRGPEARLKQMFQDSMLEIRLDRWDW